MLWLAIGKKIVNKISFFQYVLIAIFLISALAGLYIAGGNIKALGIFKGWFLVPVVLAWLVALSFDANSIKKISIPLYVSLLIVSAWAILQKIGCLGAVFYQVNNGSFIQYLSENPKRVLGPFESPNYLAMYLVPTIFLSINILDLFRSKKIKVLIALSFLLPILAVFYSGSKGGLLALTLSLLVYVNYRYVNNQKSGKRRPLFSTLLISSYLALNILYLLFAANYFVPINGSDSVRQEIYKYSIALVKDNPLFGIGLGNFQDAITQISQNNDSFRVFALPYALHPHNLLLAIWLNMGFAGLIAFLCLIVFFLKNSFSSDSPIRSSIIAAMIAILIHGLVDTTYFKNDLSVIFWLVFALSINIKNEKSI